MKHYYGSITVCEITLCVWVWLTIKTTKKKKKKKKMTT